MLQVGQYIGLSEAKDVWESAIISRLSDGHVDCVIYSELSASQKKGELIADIAAGMLLSGTDLWWCEWYNVRLWR